MIYPATGCRGYGRAQIPGSKVIYAGWNEGVALDEVGVKSGDLVQIILIRPIIGVQIPCHVVGEYEGFFRSGRSPMHTELIKSQLTLMSSLNPDKYLESVYIDCIISDLFRRKINVDWQYKPTAAYSEIFHQSNGGIIYPSVKNHRAFNIALNGGVFDRQFEVISTCVKYVTSFGYGFYSDRILHASVEFDADGKIIWSSDKTRNFRWDPQNGLREDIPYPGWRKNGNS